MSNNYESSTIVLVLPIPPSINDFYGYTAPAVHRVIKYVKTAGKFYKQKVAEYVEKNNLAIHANVPLTVQIIINFPTKHRTDLDNRMKGLLDSITSAGVWEDDSLIDELHIIRGKVGKPGGVIVKIQEADV